MDYTLLKLVVGVLCTIGLYSVLYRESKFYRFFEHIFLGLAAGWALTALWTESLKGTWWDKMVGTVADEGNEATMGNWPWIFLLPIGLMAYFVFSKKHNWISRIPIGIILGLWAGQQPLAWMNKFVPQLEGSMKPIVPNTWDSFIVPGTPAANAVYPSQALNNLIFLVTVVTVISYFIFSIDFRSKVLRGSTTAGRWLMMIGFGAIFGSTVMTRFTLLIDRMYFVWIEFLWQRVLGQG